LRRLTVGDFLRQIIARSKEPLNFSTTSQVEKSYGPAVAADMRCVAADV